LVVAWSQVGWSGAVGDMRAGHFLSLHRVQAMPLAGLWSDRGWIAVRQKRWVVLTGAMFAQAPAGLPLVRL